MFHNIDRPAVIGTGVVLYIIFMWFFAVGVGRLLKSSSANLPYPNDQLILVPSTDTDPNDIEGLARATGMTDYPTR